MTGFHSKREAAADKQHWNEDEWRKNNWRCGHGWLRGEQCESCNAPQPPSEWAGIKAILDEYGLQAIDFVADFKAALAQPVQEPVKLWLWKNFVNGKFEYLAFDNPFPIFMDSHDPQTLGEPCGYALLKPSRAGRTDVSDEQVLQDVQKALAQPVQEPVAHVYLFDHEGRPRVAWDNAKGVQIGDKLYTAPPQREWVGLTDDEIHSTAGYNETREMYQFALALIAKLKERNS